jgi:hypothetical protein
MLRLRRILLATMLFLSCNAFAQPLQPGFNKEEYVELLKLNATLADSAFYRGLPAPQRFAWVYRSPVVGLLNHWSLAIDKTGTTAAICIRGTVGKPLSWLGNFNSGLVSAQGRLVRAPGDTFVYRLANNPLAAVHLGWLTGLAYMMPGMLQRIDSIYTAGIRQLIITGHSQGGAIAYLATASLRMMQAEGKLPADLVIKTYCSAAPKPGNLFFAYDYEVMTQGGWSWTVVNIDDWVPQTPEATQQAKDFNPTNPFVDARRIIKKQRWPLRWALLYGYRKLDKPSRRAARLNQKFLGSYATRLIAKQLPGYVPPPLAHSNNYERAGSMMVLRADSSYYRRFPESKTNYFAHHLFASYLFLAERL